MWLYFIYVICIYNIIMKYPETYNVYFILNIITVRCVGWILCKLTAYTSCICILLHIIRIGPHNFTQTVWLCGR